MVFTSGYLLILITEVIVIVSLLIPFWICLIPITSSLFYFFQTPYIWINIFHLMKANEVTSALSHESFAIYCLYFHLFPKNVLSLCKSLTRWFVFIKLILANDVERNPGFFNSHLFTLCNWNLNSLGKDNFSRIKLIQAHNSLYEYDLISLCETSLNDTVELPLNMLDNYTFISSNNQRNTKHGGAGLFYRNSLPIIVRNDLSFPESLVVEIGIGKKKIFFSVIYRSPAYKHGTPQFDAFLQNYRTLYANIKKEKPFALYFTGDFNGHSNLWWKDGDTNNEGREIEELTSSLGLHQIIDDPANMETKKKPTCID